MSARRARCENARIQHKSTLEIEKFFAAVGTFQLIEDHDHTSINTTLQY